MFQAVPPPIIRSTKLYIQRQVLSDQYCCLPAIVDEVELRSISSTIACEHQIVVDNSVPEFMTDT